MKQVALTCLGVILVLAALFLVVTVPSLPDLVASNFGAGGVAQHRMTRQDYLLFMLFFTILLPLFPVFFMGVLPRLFPRLTNLPNREYWLAPDNIDQTMEFLLSVACAVGALIVLFVTGIHECILIAHEQDPPRLPEVLFWGLMTAFLLSLAGLMILLFTRFRRYV